MKRVLQIFRDGKQKMESLGVPLLNGEQGNMQTLEAMAQIVIDESFEISLANTILNERRLSD